jgi:hypothetical protein
MDVLNKKETVTGVITASLWAVVGDDSPTLGRIESMEIRPEVYRGNTVPVIEVHGTRGTAMFNWDHVEAVIFAPPDATPEPAPVPPDEDIRG